MEFFRIRRTIPFMRYSLILNAISFISFGIAVIFLITRGLSLSVDFTGGTVIEVSYPQAANLEQIRGAIEQKGWGEFQVQNFGTSRDVLIRLPLKQGLTSAQQSDQVMSALKTDTPLSPDKFFPWVQDLVQKEGPSILRCKGILSFKDDDDRFAFQGVHMILDGDHQRPWKPGEKRESRLVFIGRNLPEDKIRQGFESCLA